MTITCGLDEAGRGPVFGPLVIAGVILDDAGREKLKKVGVKDSKKLSPSKRKELEPIIKEAAMEYRIISIPPREVDMKRKRISITELEAQKMAEILLDFDVSPSLIFVDAADSQAERFLLRIMAWIHRRNPEFRLPEVICEHKADDNYLEVAAASILAKVERDRQIEELKLKIGEFGSGYPSDPLTQAFLKRWRENGKELPECVRKSWSTISNAQQSKLVDFE